PSVKDQEPIMSRTLTTCFVRSALAAVAVLAAVGDGKAGSFMRGCASRDLQILMLIEERENAEAVSTQRLTDAMLAMMHARMVCHEGRVVDALAIYDTIAHDLTSDAVLSEHIR